MATWRAQVQHQAGAARERCHADQNQFPCRVARIWLEAQGPAKNALDARLGEFDAAKLLKVGPAVIEWETGNISSSHRSLNKMTMFLMHGGIAAGMLIVPSRKLYRFLTDCIGNVDELEPYFALWRSLSVPCKTCGTTPVKDCVLEVVVIEHDAEDSSVPSIQKGTDGRAKV